MTDSTTEKHQWNWISCGACDVMADFFSSRSHFQRISSFSSISFSPNRLNLGDGPWRGTVLNLLQSRDDNELMPYCDYEQAVDKVSG